MCSSFSNASRNWIHRMEVMKKNLAFEYHQIFTYRDIRVNILANSRNKVSLFIRMTHLQDMHNSKCQQVTSIFFTI